MADGQIGMTWPQLIIELGLKLLDFFGKIVPGIILISSIAFSLIKPSELVISALYKFGAYEWITLYAISWTAGFSVQGLGEGIGVIRQYPIGKWVGRKGLTIQDIYVLQFKLEYSSTIPKPCKKKSSRNAVVREATGNGSLSIFLSIILLKFVGSDLSDEFLFVLLGTGIGLYIMHILAVLREYWYREQLLEYKFK